MYGNEELHYTITVSYFSQLGLLSLKFWGTLLGKMNRKEQE